MFDPLLDDSVDFYHRLSSLGHRVSLHTFDAMPHGYLNLGALLPVARVAVEHSCTLLERMADDLRAGAA
jgi:acetyl esterase/lipase